MSLVTGVFFQRKANHLSPKWSNSGVRTGRRAPSPSATKSGERCKCFKCSIDGFFGLIFRKKPRQKLCGPIEDIAKYPAGYVNDDVRVICLLIGKQDQEREKKAASHSPIDGSPRHVSGATAAHVCTGHRPHRSPSPSCYRRRSPAARAPAEEGAVGGRSNDSTPTLGTKAEPNRCESPRPSRRNEHCDDSTNAPQRSG